MSSHDDVLQRLLTGELDPSSDEALEFFMQHPDEKARFDEMQHLEQALGSAGATRDAEVLAALEVEDAPGEDRIANTIERHFVQDRAGGGRPPAGWWVGLLVTAAALLLVLRPWTPEPTRVPDRGPQLGTGLQLVHPRDSVERFDEFRWTYELEGGQYFIVHVYDPQNPIDPLLTSHDLEEPRWRPTPDELDDLPAKLQWEVRVMDGRGLVLLSEPAEASRSSP